MDYNGDYIDLYRNDNQYLNDGEYQNYSTSNNLTPQQVMYIDYLVQSNPLGVRKVLYKYGFPIDNGDLSELVEITSVLVNDYPQSYDDLIKQSPEFGRMLKYQPQIVKENKPQINKFVGNEQPTNLTNIELEIQKIKNNYMTNLIMIGAGALFMYLILRK